MFRTIKFQILLISATFVLLLLSQVFFSRYIQSNFIESLDLTQQAVIKVSLVRKLERDVIDLQRNVLIYKESASQSAITRFNLLMDKTHITLTTLEQLISQESDRDVFFDYITRMRGHLNDYKDNFSSVMAGRIERETLYNTGMLHELDTLFSHVSVGRNESHSDRDSLGKAKYHVARAENFMLQYLQTPEQPLIEPFQQQLRLAKAQISQQLGASKNAQSVIVRLSKVESNFQQLTQITRGYLFLVNVVMAGEANEFLFLARELNRMVTEKLTNTGVKKTLDNTRIGSDLFSAVGIMLAAATALFLTYRIMLPINIITNVFQRLAKGQNVDSIPSLERKDEIGLLANAANVFHEQNKQTTILLEQSQLLNAKQEALNTQLVASYQKLGQATASKSMFLANMSHKIRTPMNGILGMLEIVLRSQLNTSQREQLTNAAYSGQILMSLINDILDFSKIEAGKLDIESIEFSVEFLFANILANITKSAQEKNLNVRFYANPDLLAQLVGDPLRISQILLNLCSNAIKFTRNGQVSIHIDFKLHEQTNFLTLCIEVADTGIGMSPEQVSKVFDSFTQADGSTSRNFGGSGLGLSIVTQLVKLMGGSVSVESQENKGSTFKVEVLLTKTDKNHQIIAALPSPSGKLYYFTEGRIGFISPQYIEKTGLKYHHLPLSQLYASLDDITSNDAVLFDIANQNVFRTHQESIDKLVRNSLKVGFITNTQPSNLPNQLLAMWPVECLSHPFTPVQALKFLARLFNTESNTTTHSSVPINMQDVAQFEGHILLVEDNSINQAVAGEMLKLLGVTFDIAEDGQQAVTKVVNAPQYDLILMDIQMPVMDGYEATRTLRRQGHNSLVICGLSANAMKSDYEKAKEAGMDDYIVKPIKQKTLENLVAKYLPRKSA
ncbi:MAG: response regulator [Paraglaciecola sp.]|nr:response regulator [Paraglaciecola sp.]